MLHQRGDPPFIKMRLASHERDSVLRFHASHTTIPGVLSAFLAGEDDYLLHVAVRTPQELRDLVPHHIVVHRIVQHTETRLLFGVLPGAGVPLDGRTRARGPRS